MVFFFFGFFRERGSARFFFMVGRGKLAARSTRRVLEFSIDFVI